MASQGRERPFGGAWTFLVIVLLALLGLMLLSTIQQRAGSGAAIITDVAQPPTGDVTALTADDAGRPERLAALVGQPVRFDGIRVQDVVGDEAFWLSATAGRLFVHFDESGIRDDAVVVDAGQRLNITGEIRQMPSLEEAQRRWGLTPAVVEGLRGHRVYLYTRLITIVSGG